MVAAVDIGGRRVGAGHPCFVIAEAGVNHNGSDARALQLIDAAARAGADAVKFQTFKADRLATATAPKAAYQLKGTDATESQLEMLRRLELGSQTHQLLLARCELRQILFLSTPFDEESAVLLDRLGVPAFKIPSGELTNLPFIEHVARKGRPMIVSTGMADLSEVSAAVRTIEAAGNRSLILLHCVSNYPADPRDVNLRAMQTLGATFGVPIGYSDHTAGVDVPVAAVALGACVIEKHLTLDSTLPGPDQQASAEPHEFAALVKSIRRVEAALGHGRKEPAPSERDTAVVARRSLVAACDIPAGTTVTDEMIALKRPGTGLASGARHEVIGRTARTPIAAGTLLTWDLLA